MARRPWIDAESVNLISMVVNIFIDSDQGISGVKCILVRTAW
jgi:hypothetical protein